MDSISPYLGTRDELLREIKDARNIVYSETLHHEDPVEDIVLRGIWEKVLELLLLQLEVRDKIKMSCSQNTLDSVA